MFLCPAVISVTLRVRVSVCGKCSVFSVSWSGVGHKPLCYSFTASVLTAETQLQSSYCYKLCQVMKSQDETMGFHSIQKRFETHFFQFYDMFNLPKCSCLRWERQQPRQPRVVQSVTWDGDKIEEHTGTHIQWRFWSLLVASIIRICLDFQNASHIIWLCMK